MKLYLTLFLNVLFALQIAAQCAITNLTVTPSDCDGSTYTLSISFEHENAGNTFFDLFLEGELYENYLLEDLPITINGLVSTGSDVSDIAVCINDNPNCCAEAIYEVPDCGDNCMLTVGEIEIHSCEDGVFLFDFELTAQNSTAQGFSITDGSSTWEFDYGATFYTIGPFVGNGEPIVFQIIDNDNTNCGTGFTIIAPDCNTNGDCSITNVVAQATDCINGEYFVIMDFEAQNTGDEGFDVVGNGQNYGTFEYGELPITLGPFGADDVVTEFGIFENEAPNCGTEIGFDAPDCNTNGDCSITNVVAQATDCINGEYFVIMDFEAQNTGDEGFRVAGNGNDYGDFEYSELPITLGPFGADDVVTEFGIFENEAPNCGTEIGFDAPDCGNNCGIAGEIGEIECNGDGTYNIFINATADNSPFITIVIGDMLFEIQAGGEWLEGISTAAGEQELTICSQSQDDCCETLIYGTPDCDATNCIIEVGAFEAVDCANGEFYISVQIEGENGGNAGFMISTMFGETEEFGPFEYGQSTYTFGPFADMTTNDVVIFTVYDVAHPDCGNGAYTILAPDCGNNTDCAILNVHAEPLECVFGEYYVNISFESENTTEGFTIVGNGTNYGSYSYDDLPITLGPFNVNSGIDEFIVSDNEWADCSGFTGFDAPDCGGNDCSISDLALTPSECNSEGNYSLTIDFNYDNAPSEAFDVWFGTEYYGFYELADLPLTIDNLAGDGNEQVISICLDENLECCLETVYEAPSCGDCSFGDINLTTFDCVDGQFIIMANWTASNVGNEGILVNVNGEDLYILLNGQNNTIIGPFEGDGTTEYEVTITSISNPDCGATAIQEPVLCSGLLVWPGDANADNIANNMDVLNIGIAYGTEGEARSSSSNDWFNYAVQEWTEFFVGNDVNYANADSNGDGIINEEDLVAVDENYMLVHGEILPYIEPEGDMDDPLFYVDLPDEMAIETGEQFVAPIYLGTDAIPVENLYGVAFTLVFDPELIDPNSVIIEYPTSWMGMPTVNMLTFDKSFASQGEIDVTMVRNDQNNVTGQGEIASFIGIVDNIAGKEEMRIEIKDVRGIMMDETEVPFFKPVEVIAISDVLDIQQVRGYAIFPNPTQNELYIRNESGLNLEQISIIDMTGKVVKTITGSQEMISLEGLPQGVYTIVSQLEEKAVQTRILKF